MAELTKDLFEKLKAPFEANQILWKKGKKYETLAKVQALPYLHVREVKSRLDDILGPSEWKVHFEEVVSSTRVVAVRCQLAFWDDSKKMWIEKEDAAPVDSSQENGSLHLKAVYGEALVRAAAMWGIGHYLYFHTPATVDCDEQGNFKQKPSLPAEFLPESKSQSNAIAEVPVTQTPVQEQSADVVQTEDAHKDSDVKENISSEISRETAETADTTEPSTQENSTEYEYTEEEKKQATEFLKKVKTVGKAALVTYLNGPKGKLRFSSKGLKKILDEIEKSSEN